MPHYDMRILYSSAVAQDLWHDLSRKERMFLLHHCEVQRNVFKFHRQLFLSPFSVAYLTSLIQKDAKGAFSWVPAGGEAGKGGAGEPYHQSAHPLLFDPLCLFLLLPFSVGMPSCHGFRKLLDLSGHRAMVLLKIFCMLQNAIQVFLKDPKRGEENT